MARFDYNAFMQYFERAADAWLEASEIQQGYLILDGLHAHGARSWGEISYRRKMSGAADGGFRFGTLTEARQLLDDLLARYGIKV